MSNEAVQFVWARPDPPLQIVMAQELDLLTGEKRRRQRYLTAKLSPGDKMGPVYEPLKKEPALFKNFAHTPATEAEVLEFANTYGSLLGGGGTFIVADGESNAWRGEPFSLWVKEIHAVACWLRLWMMLRTKDKETVKEHIRWKGADTVMYASDPGMHSKEWWGKPKAHEHVFTARREDLSVPFKTFSRPDVLKPGWYFLEEGLNRALAVEGKGASPRMRRRPRGRLGVFFIPHGLLGAIWLQLAYAIDEGRTPLRCGYCGKTFMVGKGEARRSRKYCSDSHRVMAHQKRKKQ